MEIFLKVLIVITIICGYFKRYSIASTSPNTGAEYDPDREFIDLNEPPFNLNVPHFEQSGIEILDTALDGTSSSNSTHPGCNDQSPSLNLYLKEKDLTQDELEQTFFNYFYKNRIEWPKLRTSGEKIHLSLEEKQYWEKACEIFNFNPITGRTSCIMFLHVSTFSPQGYAVQSALKSKSKASTDFLECICQGNNWFYIARYSNTEYFRLRKLYPKNNYSHLLKIEKQLILEV